MRDLAYSPMPLYERTVHTHPMVHHQPGPLAIKPALHEPSNSSQRPHQCTSFSKSNARHPKMGEALIFKGRTVMIIDCPIQNQDLTIQSKITVGGSNQKDW